MFTAAQTIFSQLGAGRFIMATGANSFLRAKNGITFSLPTGTAKNRANRVTINQQASERFEMTFYRVWGTKLTKLDAVQDIPADRIADTLTDKTGLVCHPPTLRFKMRQHA